MHGMHEATGSNPVSSTILRSFGASYSRPFSLTENHILFNKWLQIVIATVSVEVLAKSELARQSVLRSLGEGGSSIIQAFKKPLSFVLLKNYHYQNSCVVIIKSGTVMNRFLNRISLSIILLSLSFISSTHCMLNNIKDTDSILHDDYRYLSLVHGAIAWETGVNQAFV